MIENEQLSPETIAVTTPQYHPEFLGDPTPFDVDKYADDFATTRPGLKSADTRESFANFFHGFTRPFMATGYNTAAALNRGIAAFSAHLGAVQKYVEYSTGMEHGDMWEKAAKLYEENAGYWDKLVKESGGITFLDEILSEAVGHAVPGIAQFALDVASGLTFPYMDGAVTAYEKGESPFVNGVKQAAVTGILAGLFRMIGPLKKYLQAPTMGTIFGLQEQAGAPEGQKVRAFTKGFVTGAGYSLASPGGRMGLREVEKNIEATVKEYRESRLADESGEIKAFHGSPYKFDKFKSEKIGTGEGAQAFGYGLYFTSEKDVAKHYASKLGDVSKFSVENPRSVIKERISKKLNSMSTSELKSDYARELKWLDSRISEMKTNKQLENLARDLTSPANNMSTRVRNFGKRFNIDVDDLVIEPTGQTYSVTLHKGKQPGEYDYLKWDEPVGKQDIDKVVSLAKKEGVFEKIDEMGDLYQQGNHSGQALYKTVSLGLDSDKAASAFLLRAGIDGIEYPAGSLSGKAGKGRNYVVFDENAVTMNKPFQASDLLPAITSLQPPGQQRALVSISELRDKANIPQEEFDAALLKLSQEGKIALHKHDFPGSLTPEARDKLLKVKQSDAYIEFNKNRAGVGGGEPGYDYYVGVVPKKTGFLGEQGGADFQKKPRKFLQTVEEAVETSPELLEKVKNIQPQDYIIQPNAESIAKARERISTEGIDKTIEYLKSKASPDAEKGATFIELSKQFERQGDYERSSQMIEAYDMQLREAGRFTQAASLWGQGSPQSFIRWANKQLDASRKKYGWADRVLNNMPESFKLTKEEQVEIFNRFREIKAMPEGIDRADATLQMIDIVAQKVPPSVGEMVDAYRYQNMLSSPRTQMRNIYQNMLSTFVHRPADLAMMSGVDWVKSGLFGKEREHYISDVPQYMKVAINSVPNAVQAFKESIKMARGTTMTKPELGIEAKNEFERARAAQLPKYLTVVQRFMEGTDKFNQAIISPAEYSINKKNGMSDAEAYQKGQEAAETYLLRSKLEPGDPNLSLPSKALSEVGKLITDFRKYKVMGPLAKLYVPFVKTPINYGIQMIEHSPAGLARKGFDTEQLAKPLVGSMVSLVGLMMAASGNTTWAPPTNEKEKALFYASGRKPYSIKMGDTWVPVWYTGFYALALGIPMALKHYTVDEKNNMTDEGYEQVADGLMSIAKFMGQQTSTQSIGALFSFLDGDLDYKFLSQTGFTAQQFIPGNALIRYINTWIDPVYRKPEGFIETIEKDLPGLSMTLDARMTPIMEESRRQWFNQFTPYDIGKTDEKYEALYNLEKLNSRSEYLNKKNSEIRGKKNSKMDERIDESLEVIEAMPKAFKY